MIGKQERITDTERGEHMNLFGSKVLKTALILLHRVSAVIMLIYGGIGILAELLNPPVFENLLVKLHVSLNYDELWIIGWISLAFFIVTGLAKKYFFGEQM